MGVASVPYQIGCGVSVFIALVELIPSGRPEARGPRFID